MRGDALSRRRIVRPQMLPALLTLGNLFCGFLAIAKAADAMREAPASAAMIDLLQFAGWMIFLGMVFDALDGSVARLSGGTSAMGNVLDSLSDVITFGAAPAFLAKCIAEGVGGMHDRRLSLWFSVFFALMAALRLARYSSHQGDPEEANLWFEGLPTPGAAGVIAAVAILLGDEEWRPEDTVLRFLPWVTLGLGLLMVSRVPFAHATNRFLKGRKPVTYLVMALLVIVLSLAWRVPVVLAGVLLVYTASGPVVWVFRRREARRAPLPGRSPVGVRGEDEA